MKFELEAEWSKKNSAKTLHNIFILSYGVKILVVAEVNCPERGIIGIIAWKNPCLGGIYRFWFFSITFNKFIN